MEASPGELKRIGFVARNAGYPSVRYVPEDGFGYDLVTRLGEAFRWTDLEVESKVYGQVAVPVVSARTLWRMKKDTLRYTVLAERFGFKED